MQDRKVSPAAAGDVGAGPRGCLLGLADPGASDTFLDLRQDASRRRVIAHCLPGECAGERGWLAAVSGLAGRERAQTGCRRTWVTGVPAARGTVRWPVASASRSPCQEVRRSGRRRRGPPPRGGDRGAGGGPSVSVLVELSPSGTRGLPERCRPAAARGGFGGGRAAVCGGQARICLRPSPWAVTEILRGLALSATGMRRVSTPAS